MSLEMWIFLGLIACGACGALVWYLYRRSQKDADKNKKAQTGITDTVDHADGSDHADGGYEDRMTDLLRSDDGGGGLKTAAKVAKVIIEVALEDGGSKGGSNYGGGSYSGGSKGGGSNYGGGSKGSGSKGGISK